MDYKRMATGLVGLVCLLTLEGYGLQDRYVKDAEKYMDLGLYGKAIAKYETTDGCISKSDYMKYVKCNFDDKYRVEACAINRIAGVRPSDMEGGISEFLYQHNSTFKKANWAPSYTRTGVASRIETMICKGISVVFSYYSPDNFLYMYSSIDDARMMINDVDYVDSHYITILGWTQYLKDNGDYGYILKIISCGNIYYINYDNFARKIGAFTNILEIE